LLSNGPRIPYWGDELVAMLGQVAADLLELDVRLKPSGRRSVGPGPLE